MKTIGLPVVLLGTLALPGCFATLSKSECETSDWRTIGLEDASKGREAAYIANHRKACAKHGITPDLDAYQQGRSLGLQQYCTPANGFYQGKEGNRYHGVCPAESQDAFMSAYNEGKALYSLRGEIGRLNSGIDRDQKRLAKIKEDIYTVETQLGSAQTPDEQRPILVQDLRKLRDRQESLEKQLTHKKSEAGAKQARYDRLVDQYKY